MHGADKDEVLKRMREIRRAYGVPFTKRVTEGEFSSEFKLEGNYHGTRVEISTSRENVCEKVIVGEEKIEVTVPDPDLVSQVPLVTRTVTQKRHEWVCPEELGG